LILVVVIGNIAPKGKQKDAPMAYVKPTLMLTDDWVLTMVRAAMAKATEIGQPQCIVIVDASGESVSEFRMEGAKFLSLKSARAKARTAASIRVPSNAIPEAVHERIALATEGCVTGLPGGLPVVMDGEVVGGIGIGSGSGDQDIAVANAALAAIEAQVFD
jgi:glc operon protein GlcG